MDHYSGTWARGVDEGPFGGYAEPAPKPKLQGRLGTNHVTPWSMLLLYDEDQGA